MSFKASSTKDTKETKVKVKILLKRKLKKVAKSNNTYKFIFDCMKDPFDIYMNTLVPMVIEQTPRGERSFDIYSRLLKKE